MINLLGVRLVCLTITIGLACLMADQCGPAGTARHTSKFVASEQVTTEVLLSTTSVPNQTPGSSQPAASASPIPLSIPAPRPEPTPMEEMRPMTITVVYDNNAHDSRLQTAWGFACLIEQGETIVLFDTGGDGEILLSNMAVLGFDSDDVDIVVLSHIHGDHTAGLSSLLATGVRPTVYLPHSFPASFKTQVRASTTLVEVEEAIEISDGIYTTGQMGAGVIEQALVLSTPQGLVVVTGCAHPGIVEMVGRAKEVGREEVYLVLGGFHLGGTNDAKISEIIANFRRLGVQKVAPCHCTGDKAIGLFRDAYREDFIRNGVGTVLASMK